MGKKILFKCLIILKIIFLFKIFYIYYLNIQIIFKYKNIQNPYFSIEQDDYFRMYLNLQNKQFQKKNILKEKEEQEIFNLLNNTTYIDKIYYNSTLNFGNLLVSLNKLIINCKIIKCKSLVLDKEHFWFIKNRIEIPTINISIESGEYNKSLYFNNKLDNFFFFSKFTSRNEIKINFLRNEIIKNLPKIHTSKDYLYIHIRSGDIFSTNIHIYYSQPPLCFYQKILNNYNFRKIYIISINKNNPIIEKLIYQYPNIIYSKNSIELDISFLVNAYNIAASVSSFLNLIIQINYNLEFLWDYNIYRISEKILLYHYDFYKHPYNSFTIYRMEPSSIYKKKMYYWRYNKIQRKLMYKEKCNNYFTLIHKVI